MKFEATDYETLDEPFIDEPTATMVATPEVAMFELEKQPPEKTSPEPSRPGTVTPDANTKAAEYDIVTAPTTVDYPQGARLAAIVVSLLLGMFLVALDNVRCTLFAFTHYGAKPRLLLDDSRHGHT